MIVGAKAHPGISVLHTYGWLMIHYPSCWSSSPPAGSQKGAHEIGRFSEWEIGGRKTKRTMWQGGRIVDLQWGSYGSIAVRR